MRDCWRSTGWKCVKRRCSNGRRYWKRESADWKTGFECSGRRSLKRWAKRTGSNGFKKWNGSVGLSCFTMGVGSLTTGDCELRRGKRDVAASGFRKLPLPHFRREGRSVHPYWLVRSQVFQPQIGVSGDCVNLRLLYRVEVELLQEVELVTSHGAGRDQWIHAYNAAFGRRLAPPAAAGHHVGKKRCDVRGIVDDRCRNLVQVRHYA